MRRLRVLALLLASVASLALAACGGDSAPTKSEWQEDYRPVNEQIKTLGQQVGDALVNARGKTNAELVTQFQGLATQTTQAAKDLDEVETPDDAAIEKDQTALVSALNQGARDLNSVASAAEAGNTKVAAAAAAKLVKDSTDIRNPRQRLEKQLAASN